MNTLLLSRNKYGEIMQEQYLKRDKTASAEEDDWVVASKYVIPEDPDTPVNIYS